MMRGKSAMSSWTGIGRGRAAMTLSSKVHDDSRKVCDDVVDGNRSRKGCDDGRWLGNDRNNESSVDDYRNRIGFAAVGMSRGFIGIVDFLREFHGGNRRYRMSVAAENLRRLKES